MDLNQVDAIYENLKFILVNKHNDYGPGNINNAYGGPMNGLLVRIGDKFERIKNLSKEGKASNYEPLEDSFRDLANYCVIALLVMEGKWDK